MVFDVDFELCEQRMGKVFSGDARAIGHNDDITKDVTHVFAF